MVMSRFLISNHSESPCIGPGPIAIASRTQGEWFSNTSSSCRIVKSCWYVFRSSSWTTTGFMSSLLFNDTWTKYVWTRILIECDVLKKIGFDELRIYISCHVWLWRRGGLITEPLTFNRYRVGSGTKLDCRRGCCNVLDGLMMGDSVLFGHGVLSCDTGIKTGPGCCLRGVSGQTRDALVVGGVVYIRDNMKNKIARWEKIEWWEEGSVLKKSYDRFRDIYKKFIRTRSLKIACKRV